ncbi:hypothetical protein ACFV9W_24110 [Streptomyces sp. NPDC059897]|uniref:hypothetical protein n=1 Tax=Streptomyces sp. NPDC059897 TaxID=3346994 RepID=UPI00364ABCB7
MDRELEARINDIVGLTGVDAEGPTDAEQALAQERARRTRVRACQGKTEFLDRESAELRLREIRERPRHIGGVPQRVYECPQCGRWHLSSRAEWQAKPPKRPEPAASSASYRRHRARALLRGREVLVSAHIAEAWEQHGRGPSWGYLRERFDWTAAELAGVLEYLAQRGVVTYSDAPYSLALGATPPEDLAPTSTGLSAQEQRDAVAWVSSYERRVGGGNPTAHQLRGALRWSDEEYLGHLRSLVDLGLLRYVPADGTVRVGQAAPRAWTRRSDE